VFDGGESYAAVSADRERPVGDVGEGGEGALVHELQRAEAGEAGTQLVTGLERHVDDTGGTCGQVAPDRLRAVSESEGA